MASLYADAASRPGRTVIPSEQGMRGASTDMGNVSHLVPSIHPFIGYNTNKRDRTPSRVHPLRHR